MHGLLNKAGIRCSVEDKHQFRSLYPSDNTRADLTARGFGNMGQDLLMDFCCSHPGAKCYSKKKKHHSVPRSHISRYEEEEEQDVPGKGQLIKHYFYALLLCPWLLMFMALCRSPSSPRLSEISGTPVNLVAKHWIQRFSFATYKFYCETFSDKRIIVNGSLNRAQDHSAFRKCVIDDTT
jgi:hypothetical protein